MSRMLLAAGLGVSLLLGAAPVHAEKKIDVGRLTAVFQEDGWQGSADLPYNHELMSAQGTFRGKGKVFSLLASDASPLAVMYIGATYGQVKVRTPRSDCGKNAELYVRDFNDSKLENYRCVYAGGLYESADLLARPLRYLNEAGKTTAVRAPQEAFFALVNVSAKGGYLLDIEVLLAPEFVGLAAGKPLAELPADLPAEVAAWADRLAEASVTALTSFSGNVVSPPVVFADPAK